MGPWRRGESMIQVAGQKLPPLEGGRQLWDRGEGEKPRSVGQYGANTPAFPMNSLTFPPTSRIGGEK